MTATRLSIIALILVACSLLAGCASDPRQSNRHPIVDPVDPVTEQVPDVIVK